MTQDLPIPAAKLSASQCRPKSHGRRWPWLSGNGYLANVAAYCGTSVISQAALAIQGFVVRRFIAPQLLGIWNLVAVFQSFLGTFDPGITTAAFRELAVLNGTGNQAEATTVRSTALWSRIGYSIVLASVLLYKGHDKTGVYALGLLAGATITVLSATSESFVTFYQSAQEYVRLSRATLTYSLSAATLLSLGAWLGGIYGLIGTALVGGMIQLGLLVALRPKALAVRPTWSWAALKRLIAFGLPFRLVDYPGSLMAILDVLWIGRFLNPGALAIYVTARSLLNLAVDIPARMGSVFISRICNVGAVPERRPGLAKELSAFLLVQYLVIFPVIIIGIGAMMSLLVRSFLPSYAAAVPVLRWLLLAIYFVPQTTIVRNFWMLDKRLVSLGVTNLVGLAATATSIFVSTTLNGRTLPSLARGTVVGYALYYTCVMFTAGREVWGLKHAAYLVVHAVGSALVLGWISAGPAQRAVTGDWAAALHDLTFSLARNVAIVTPLLLYGGCKLRVFLNTRTWQRAEV